MEIYGASSGTSSPARGREAKVGKSMAFVKSGNEGIIGQATIQLLSLNTHKKSRAVRNGRSKE